MRKTIITLAALLMCIGAFCQNGYKKASFTYGGVTLPYRYLEPQVQQNECYPLVLFLHGAGERGNDNQAQLTHGSDIFLNNAKQFPAYVVFPQCPKEGYWAYSSRPASFDPHMMPESCPETPEIEAVMALVDYFIANKNVDTSRLYLVGLSMGAMAIYDILIRYPNRFAAAEPICGTVNPARLGGNIVTSIRIFHGDVDNVVPVEASREAYATLDWMGVDVEYIEYPGVNHGAWVPAFKRDDFLPWLFSHSL